MIEKKNLIYTPKCHIPIGEAIVTDGGERVLRMKKARSSEVEDITLGELGELFEQSIVGKNTITSIDRAC